MNLSLSPEVIVGLKRLGNPTLVSDETFLKILLNGVRTITQSECPETLYTSSGFPKGDVFKEALSALLCLFIESARMDMSPDALIEFVKTEVHWPESRLDKLYEVYRNESLKIQALLSNIGYHPPHIVDVRWKSSYNVKSSSNGHSSSLITSVQFETEGPAVDKDNKTIKFSCTLPELQDLLAKFREAQRQMEHVSQLNHQ